MKKRIIIILIICCVVILSVSAAVYFSINAYYSAFTPQKWENYPEKRGQMIESLIASEELIGMNTSKLQELLGEADKEENQTYMYELSADRSVYLAVKYNQSDIITRVYTTRSGADTPLTAY
jgi:flagellar basal body-associated protein FliL